MSLRLTLEKAHQALENAEIPHALIGGMGLATLGIHRATQDVDMIIDGDLKERAKATLAQAQFHLKLETPEVLHFEGVGRLDLLLANRPLSREMIRDAKAYPQHKIKCVSPEGIIGLKIQAYTNDKKRELQDKADIQSLIEIYPELDWEKIKSYAELFGEWKTIEALRASNDV